MRILGSGLWLPNGRVASLRSMGAAAQGGDHYEAKENKLQTLPDQALVLEARLKPSFWDKNMDDSLGDVHRKRKNSCLCWYTPGPVCQSLWDERLTTIEANEILIESGVRREDRKKVIDKIAATLILQSYLGSLK